MNVLMLTHRTPFPPDRGDRIRAWRLLDYLARRASVSLACVDESPPSASVRDRLAGVCDRVAVAPVGRLQRVGRDLAAVACGRAASEGHFWSPSLAQTIDRWAAERPFDAVVCFCSGMYRYCRLASLRDAKTVVDLVDVDSEKWTGCAEASAPPARWVLAIEARRVRRLEQRIASEADELLVISDAERETLHRTTGSRRVRVAGNGVDTIYFQPPRDEPSPGRPTCCFVGVLNYQPNVEGVVWFAREVWPRVIERFADARLRVVGKAPTVAIERLAYQPGISVFADVPDVRPHLAASTVSIAPLRIARGVQNKVLEAMAMALPVVASPEALTGISAGPRDGVTAASGVDEWVNAIGQLFADPDLAHGRGASGRQFVLDRHVWEETLAPFGAALGLPEASPAAEEVTLA